MKNLALWRTQNQSFQNQNTFLIFNMDKGEHPVVSSCVPVSVAEHASISLNMSKYPWKCFNRLFQLCQGSEYAWSSYMFDRLLMIPPVLQKPGFWIWRSCIYKGYAESQYIWYAPYTSIMTEYASTYLNVPQYTWTWLNIAECASMCLKIPEQTLLTMPGFSICHNIIIITSLLQPLLN